MNWYDRELETLDRDLANGTLTQTEYNQSLRDLEREYAESAREAAENAAERAYRDTLENYP